VCEFLGRSGIAGAFGRRGSTLTWAMVVEFFGLQFFILWGLLAAEKTLHKTRDRWWHLEPYLRRLLRLRQMLSRPPGCGWRGSRRLRTAPPSETRSAGPGASEAAREVAAVDRPSAGTAVGSLKSATHHANPTL